MFCTRVAWVCLQLCKEEGSYPVSAITERTVIGLYEVSLSRSLLGFVMGTMLANFYMCGIMLVLSAVLCASCLGVRTLCVVILLSLIASWT